MNIKLSKNLLFVILLAGLLVAWAHLAPPASADDPPAFLAMWGVFGTGEGEFSYPPGIAVDSLNNVYVADAGNNRIQKFDNNGDFLRMWGFGVNTGASAFEICTAATMPCQAGSAGGGDGQFNLPLGVAVDSADNVYVVEAGIFSSEHRVQKFDSNGGFITKWGSTGDGDSEFDSPTGIAADNSGNIYVADQGNQRIQKFDSAGGFLRMWGFGVNTGASAFEICTDVTVPCEGGISGAGDGQFDLPLSVAVDSADNVYVTEASPTLGRRVQKFDSDGNFLRMWGFGVSTGANVFEICTGSCQAGIVGIGDGQFVLPAGVTVDSSSNVYVTDRMAHRVQKFDNDGNFLTKWGGGPLADPGQFNAPVDVAADSDENIFVVEESNHRVQKFGFTPLVLTKTVDDDLPNPGQLITYTITVDNRTITTATSVAISDTLPAGLSFAGPIMLEGTSGVTNPPPNIASGLTVTGSTRITVTLPVTVNTGQDHFTVINNTAAVTSPDLVEPHIDSKSILLIDVSEPFFFTLDEGTGSPLITPTLGITLSFSPAFFEVYPAFDNGETLTYTLTLTGSSINLQLQTTAGSTATAQITFSPPSSLPTGTYSWTVRAEDAAGNLSDLIAPQSFSIQADDNRIYIPTILKD